MDCDARRASTYYQLFAPTFFLWAIFSRKERHTELFLACDQSSLGLVQHYKCLYAAVTICSTLVNIEKHTHRKMQHFDQLI